MFPLEFSVLSMDPKAQKYRGLNVDRINFPQIKGCAKFHKDL